MDIPPPQPKITRADIVSGFRILLRLLTPYRKDMTIFVVFGILVSIGDALVPYLVGSLVDSLVQPDRVVHIGNLIVPLYLAILSVWAILRLASLYMQDYLWRYSDIQGMKVYTDYLVDSFSHLLRLPLGFHKTNKTGEVIQKVSMTADNIESIVAGTLLQLGPQLLSIVVALVVTLFISVPIGVFLLAGVTLYLIFFIRGARPLAQLQTDMYANSTEAWGDTWDYVTNVRQVKEAVAENVAEQSMSKSFREIMLNTWKRFNIASANLSLYQHAIILFSQFSIFVYSIYTIFGGFMTIGELLAVNGYTQMIFGPFSILTRSWRNVQNGIININKTEKMLVLPEETYVPHDAVPLDTIHGDVSFEQVDFGYDEGRPILKDLSFSVARGQTVAIVGESGVGKTTLLDLLLGFHFPTRGTVRIDGVDITRLDLRTLRTHTAIVSQDIVLFNDTITKNIAFGMSNATEADVQRVAEQASAREFIEAFPDGWNQLVGERGIKLSGGQRQRVAIARAILKDPSILILDEPTSALDARTEHALQQSLNEIMSGKTTFIIAHRFSTVRNADLILVLKDGTIAERGTHAELMALGGEYRHLYDLQIGLRE